MNPLCEYYTSSGCEQKDNTSSEVRLLKKISHNGYDFLCKTCFEKEVAWRVLGGLYHPILMPAPKWEQAKVFNK